MEIFFFFHASIEKNQIGMKTIVHIWSLSKILASVTSKNPTSSLGRPKGLIEFVLRTVVSDIIPLTFSKLHAHLDRQLATRTLQQSISPTTSY